MAIRRAGYDTRAGLDHYNARVTIGIIGAGALAQALAKRLIAGGYTVILSNRHGLASLEPVIAALGPAAIAGTVDEAVVPQIVIIAIPWGQLPETLGRFSDWDGRVLVDTTNPIEPPHYTVAELGGRTSSELVADLVPGARLVKAFNTLTPTVLARDPGEAGGRRVIFYSGDDTAAKQELNAVLTSCGFAGVDLGDLATGGRLQQFPGGPLPGLNLIRLG